MPPRARHADTSAENIIILQNKVDLIKSEMAMKHYGRSDTYHRKPFSTSGGMLASPKCTEERSILTVNRVNPTVHSRHCCEQITHYSDLRPVEDEY
jgi:hypothetical protein